MSANPDWWRGAVIYQIYPRSFMDSNNDGIGDLKGITSKLDYVADLGADAVWISPFFTSPMRDFGYDVADYRNVDAIFGDLDDFRALLARAHELGLKVIIDQVLSHTSDQHPWFRESKSSANNEKSDWYVWSDAQDDSSTPNNWLAVFGGSAWEFDEPRQQYYFHNFLKSQPDLNFHNPAVRTAQLDNIRFWLDLGVDGFRFDVVNFFFHSVGLEDNPLLDSHRSGNPSATANNPYFGQRHIYDIDQPQSLGFLREVRNLLNEYSDRSSVGEISSDNSLRIMAEYTGDGDKLHMAYTFDFLTARNDSDFLRETIADVETGIGDGWPCWALSNHDVERSASRWGKDDDPILFPRISVAFLLCLRGSVSLYQGEELGFREASLNKNDIQDPYGLEFWPDYQGRDGCRTPMVWSQAESGGFSTGKSWLPVDNAQLPFAVERQQVSANSSLKFIKRLILWRKNQPALVRGSIELLPDCGDMLCWYRTAENQSLLVALNMTSKELRCTLPCAIGKVLSGHGFEGRIEGDDIVLPPYNAFFAELSD